MDIYFWNSCAQFVVLVFVMVVIGVAHRSIGSREIVIGFEALLLTVLLRRIDEVAIYFGIDVFDRPAMTILTWIVIFIFMVAFWETWRRRREIRHIEGMLKRRERYQETLRKDRDTLEESRQKAGG